MQLFLPLGSWKLGIGVLHVSVHAAAQQLSAEHSHVQLLAHMGWGSVSPLGAQRWLVTRLATSYSATTLTAVCRPWIQVATTQSPMSYVNIARTIFHSHAEATVSALGNAIDPLITGACTAGCQAKQPSHVAACCLFALGRSPMQPAHRTLPPALPYVRPAHLPYLRAATALHLSQCSCLQHANSWLKPLQLAQCNMPHALPI